MTEATGVEITPREDAAPAEQAQAAPAVEQVAGDLTPLMRIALENDRVEALERLVDMIERREKRDAEMAMAEALAGFQAACPDIPRTGVAEVRKNGSLKYTYDYPKLDVVARTIREPLAAHGLSYSHDAEIDGNTVAVTCTLRHVAGAMRTATFTGPIDTSGGKNPIQQVASARSYGRRYSLMDVLGLAAGEDDDGAAAGAPAEEVKTITEKQAADLDVLIDEVEADREKFLEWIGAESLADIPARDHKRAKRALERKREGAS